MYQAPEIKHLQDAVAAIKKGITPEIAKNPQHSKTDIEDEQELEQDGDKE